MVDTTDLKSVGHCDRAGSSPADGTTVVILNSRNMRKANISALAKSIHINAKRLQSMYSTLSDYKFKIYNLYLRKSSTESDWEEDLYFDLDLCELLKEYNAYKKRVKCFEKEQTECKILLKSLTREK